MTVPEPKEPIGVGAPGPGAPGGAGGNGDGAGAGAGPGTGPGVGAGPSPAADKKGDVIIFPYGKKATGQASGTPPYSPGPVVGPGLGDDIIGKDYIPYPYGRDFPEKTAKQKIDIQGFGNELTKQNPPAPALITPPPYDPSVIEIPNGDYPNGPFQPM